MLASSYLMLAFLLAAPAGLAGEAIPIPRQKPQHAAEPVPIPRQKPKSLVQAAPPESSGWPAAQVAAERASCDAMLKGLALVWSPLPPLGDEGGCGAPAPILLSAVDGVSLTPPATVTCAMAAALHNWVSGSLQPLAQRDLGARVVAIATASSYVCRSRNSVTGAKLSEHGKANALDMSGFAFAGRDGVTVGSGWGGVLAKFGLSRPGSFLDDARQAACTSFTTVLGPGSDSYHGTHFHVDVLARHNGSRICQ